MTLNVIICAINFRLSIYMFNNSKINYEKCINNINKCEVLETWYNCVWKILCNKCNWKYYIRYAIIEQPYHICNNIRKR